MSLRSNEKYRRRGRESKEKLTETISTIVEAMTSRIETIERSRMRFRRIQIGPAPLREEEVLGRRVLSDIEKGGATGAWEGVVVEMDECEGGVGDEGEGRKKVLSLEVGRC